MNQSANLLFKRALIGVASLMLLACGGGGGSGSDDGGKTAGNPDDSGTPSTTTLLTSTNSSGVLATYSANGAIDSNNPFFKTFGNGRSCASCHQASDAWSLTPDSVKRRFDLSSGTDPLFSPHDAANSPLADVSSIEARRAAYSMLMNKAVIRMSLPVPASAEFELAAVDDPYGYASASGLSLFRRPLPAANLKFNTAFMWDGRETYRDSTSANCFIGTSNCFSSLEVNLAHQANNANFTHAQATQDLTDAEQQAIVNFEKGLFTAQLSDDAAMGLTGAGAKGGPMALFNTAFYFGINDRQAGDYRTRAPFNANAMSLFGAWNTDTISDPDVPAADASRVTAARRSIARGEAIFNTREMNLTNVSGLPGGISRGTCTTCHNAPNSGGQSTPLLMDIGVAAASNRTADMPLYTLRNKVTGETIQTMDPGAALVSGKWEDIGRLKVPALRALAARPPYFHNGSAADLRDVVVFYNTRFAMHLSSQEIIDLTNFLKAL